MLRMRFARPVLLALAACAGMAAASPVCGQVQVNEILGDPGVDWNGDGTVSARDDEWVEIVNAGTGPVVLDDYRLSDGGNRLLRYGFAGTLLPGAVQVVFGSTSVAWESTHGVSAVGLSLNNTGDSVRLWKIAGADTVLVDSYTYAAFEVLDDRSVGGCRTAGRNGDCGTGIHRTRAPRRRSGRAANRRLGRRISARRRSNRRRGAT